MLKTIRKKLHGDLFFRLDLYEPVMKTLQSYVQNQQVMNQNVDWNKSETYRYFHELHNLMELYEPIDGSARYCRMGKDNDGGYIMLEPFSNTKIAYSIGINDDVSWDKS